MEKNKIYTTREEILEVTQKAMHIPFKELDTTLRLKSIKGGVGQMVEESVFQYKVNSDSAPDFEELGIELKATPFQRMKKGGFRAKERLVLNIINYMTENFDSFYDSHFWFKNHEILMMFYEHKESVLKEEFYFDNYCLFQWPDNDLQIVMQDWYKISKKIKEGKAHELSESDTLYLAACTKGSTAITSFRNQPFSEIKAKQRAYSLKQSYMTYLLNHYVYGNEQSEKIIKSSDELVDLSFEDIIKKMFSPYIGQTQKDLVKSLGIVKSKQTNSSIINKILKLNSDISKTEEFQKANITCKTIRIETDGSINESMSFPTFKFKEIVNQKWEDSDFYKLLQTRFMFVIFQKVDETDESSFLKDVKFWGMPTHDVDECERCFLETKIQIASGVKIIKSNGKFMNSFPKSKNNRVAHVRPHASKSYYKFDDYLVGKQSDGDELPDGRWMTKQCFWLNRDYVKKIIHENQ